jgi:hypothetical protein
VDVLNHRDSEGSPRTDLSQEGSEQLVTRRSQAAECGQFAVELRADVEQRAQRPGCVLATSARSVRFITVRCHSAGKCTTAADGPGSGRVQAAALCASMRNRTVVATNGPCASIRSCSARSRSR